MRVAMVIQVFWPVLGGAQRQVERLGPPLAARGVTVDVITRRVAGTPALSEEPGLALHRVGRPTSNGALASLQYTVLGARKLAGLRPDVIHSHDLLSPSTVALLGSRAGRIPTVVKVLSAGLGGDIDRLLRKPFGARRLREIADRFAAFIALSDEVETELVAHGVPASRIRRIPNGVDPNVFRPARGDERRELRTRFGVSDDETMAVYCGRLYETKHVDVLVSAAASAGIRLLVFGTGPVEQQLRAQADDPALLGRVKIMDPVADPAPIYRAADVYLSASEAEGMSGSVLEAMASGLTVIAAPASGMSELLGGGAGVVTADRDPQTFAAELARLHAEPREREALGGAARERVLERYSLDVVAGRLVDLYAEVQRTPPEAGSRS